MKAPAKAVQEKNPQRDGKIPFLCGFILYHMVQNNYRTAAEGKHVAAADPPQAENPVNRILFYNIGKSFDFLIWYKIIIALRWRGSMSLPRTRRRRRGCCKIIKLDD